MKLSVIIPSYNNSDFLTRCLGSLPASSPSLQIIIVDDGSTDNTTQVLSQIKERDPGVEVIIKENGGVSSARNCGLKVATGDYVLFLDADDILTSGSIEEILSRKYTQDLIIMRMFDASEKYPWKSDFDEDTVYGAGDLMKADYIRGSVCGCLFRMEFIRERDLTFYEDLSLAEDTVFFARVLDEGARVSFSDIRLYEVNVRAGSASRNYNEDFIIRLGRVLPALRNNVKDRCVADHTLLVALFAIVNVAAKIGYNAKDIRQLVDVDGVLPLAPTFLGRNAIIVRILNNSFTLFFAIKKWKDKISESISCS